MERRMPGGRNDGATRVGKTVRRKAGDQTPAVQALLRHLAAVGFTRAPRALGLDDQGREMLSYLEGDTVGDRLLLPEWALSDVALVAVGEWLRDFHSAVKSFELPPDCRWFNGLSSGADGEIIGHHDAGPYNAVWQVESSSLAGFIDWDLAAPAEPAWDLAFVALSWVPLAARDVAAIQGFPADGDRARRLRLLLAAYEWEGPTAELLEVVRRRAVAHAFGLRAAADAGYGPAMELVAEGVAEAFDRAAAELHDSDFAD